MTVPRLVLQAALGDPAMPVLPGLPDALTGALRRKGVAVVADRDPREVRARIAAEREEAHPPLRSVVAGITLLGSAELGPAPPVAYFWSNAVAAASEAIDAIDPRTVTILLYTQRQDRLMESSYVCAVARGASRDFDQQFPYRFDPLFDYVDLSERLGAIERVDSLAVRPGDLTGGNSVTRFRDALSACGVSLPRRLARRIPAAAPRYYSRMALELTLAMNPHLDTDAERTVVRDFLSGRFGTDDTGPPDILPPDERARILDAYAETNRAFFQRYLPHLPADSYASQTGTPEHKARQATLVSRIRAKRADR